jgi:hypothetical protein
VKLLREPDLYELLDVGRDAPREEIERAYRLAAATFEDGSLATYSIYSPAEVTALRERMDHAWSVLGDPEARAAYDRTLAGRGQVPEEAVPLDLDFAFEEAVRPDLLPASLAFEEALEEDGSPFDGARLRRNRLQRGIELEQIARVTKVSPSYLRFIEEEDFASLPAPVYVRGFVTAYARCLGLDPGRVVPDYMERLEAERVTPPPLGLFAATVPVRRRGRR